MYHLSLMYPKQMTCSELNMEITARYFDLCKVQNKNASW